MGRAAQAVTVGFAGLVIFEVALAAGAPLGAAAWGGASADLTTGQKVASAVMVLFWLVAIRVVRGRAAGRTGRLYRWGTWVLVVLLGGSAALNAASDSRWENLLLAPVALVLAVLCAAVANESGQAARLRRTRGGRVSTRAQ